jgi:DNA replication protein DnaC
MVRVYAPAEEQKAPSATCYIDEQIGRRYTRCKLDNFDTTGDKAEAKLQAVEECRSYVNFFAKHFEAGRSLVLVGPKGTGKDHLLSAVVREIARRIGRPGAVVFRDGLTLFAEIKEQYNTQAPIDLVAKYVSPMLFAVSDPVPPVGALSQHDQSMMLRIIDGRYRQCHPLAVTINCKSRQEINDRLGAQAADRLFDCAVVVGCNWESYRKPFGGLVESEPVAEDEPATAPIARPAMAESISDHPVMRPAMAGRIPVTFRKVPT